MSESVTLATLRTLVRQRADMENNLFISNTELNGYIDNSYADYYDFLIEAGVDYYGTSSNITISTGNTMALPSTFLHLRGIDDISDPNNPLTVRKYNFAERNEFDNFGIAGINDTFSEVFYRLYGETIQIMPTARAIRPYKIYFIPRRTLLAGDSDAIDAINGWHEYIINDAAIKCLNKEESDVRPLMAANAAIKDRIRKASYDRDAAQPERVTRIRNRRDKYGLGWATGHDGF